MPIGCHDDIMPWGKVGDDLSKTKYGFGKFLQQIDGLVPATSIPRSFVHYDLFNFVRLLGEVRFFLSLLCLTHVIR